MLRSLFTSVVALFVFQGCALFAPNLSLRHPPTAADSATMAAAQEYAATVSNKMADLNAQLQIVKTSTNMLLIGTAMGGVGAAALQGSRDLLIGLGLGSAGILVFQYGTGMTTKQSILDDAQIAIACAETTAIKISQQKSGQPGPPGSSASEGFLSSSLARTPAGAQSAQNMEMLADTLDSLSVPPAAQTAPVPGAPLAPVLRAPGSRLASVVRDAASSQQHAVDSAQAALDITAMTAPDFLVSTVYKIELATVDLLHKSEPQGRDILSYATAQSQAAVKVARDAVASAKSTTQKSSATVRAAQDVGITTTDDPGQKAQVQQTARAAQSDLANTEQKLSVIEAVLSNAANCKKLTD